jgi:type I restriction enzyme S subunit
MTKDEWKTVALGDVAEFVRGINFKPDDVVPTRTPGSVACMRTKNVQAELDLSDVWSVGEQFVRREDQFLQAGDVLVSSANSWNLVGKCCWIPELTGRTSFGGFVSVLRPQRAKVEPRFLFRWFSSDRIQTTLRSFGQQTTNISNLNTDRCLKLPLPLPPLAEQRRIAEVLDRAEALRAKRRAALAQLDSLTQSLFLDLFGDPATNPKGWPMKTLGDLVAEFRYGSSNKSANQGKPALRIPNVAGGTIDLTNLKLVPVDAAEFERLRLCDGDLLFVRTNGNPDFVGRCAVFDSKAAATSGFAGNEFIFASYLIRARLAATNIASVFLREYLLGDEGRRQLRSRSKTSAGQFNINTESLGAIPVPLPPITLQREFARRVTAVEALKTAHRASLAELDALFATLQHRAFRGEL